MQSYKVNVTHHFILTNQNMEKEDFLNLGMAKSSKVNLLPKGENPFLTEERENLWDRLRKNGKPISKKEVIARLEEIKGNSRK